MAKIRQVPDEAEALGVRGEDYRKVWARLRYLGIPASKEPPSVRIDVASPMWDSNRP